MLYNSLLTALLLFSSFENSECAGSRLLKMPNNLDYKPVDVLNAAKEATANKLGDINGIAETIKNGANDDIFSGFVPAQNSMNKLIFLIKNGYMTAAQAVEYGLATKDQLIADGVAQLSDFGISGEDGEDAVIGNTGNRFLNINQIIAAQAQLLISSGAMSVADAISAGYITAAGAVEKGYISAQDAVEDGLVTAQQLINEGVAVLSDYGLLSVTDTISAVQDGVLSAAEAVQDGYIKIGEAITGGILTVSDAIEDGFITATEAVEDGYITAKDAVNDGLLTVVDAVKEGLMTAQDAVDDGLATADQLINAGVAVLADFGDVVEDAANDVKDWWCDTFWC